MAMAPELEADTALSQKRKQIRLVRQQCPAQRAAALVSLSDGVREMALAGIRGRHPTASPRELACRLTVRLYGREVAARLFRDIPGDAR